MLFLLVSVLLLLLLHVASPVHAQTTARPIFFEDLPQCARYSYLQSAKDSPCHDSPDRYCLCAATELGAVLAATHSHAVLFCEPRASEATGLIADWLDFVCDPKLAHYRRRRRRRWTLAPRAAPAPANETDGSMPGKGKPRKGGVKLRRLKRGAIAGIVLAAVVSMGILGAAVYFCFRAC